MTPKDQAHALQRLHELRVQRALRSEAKMHEKYEAANSRLQQQQATNLGYEQASGALMRGLGAQTHSLSQVLSAAGQFEDLKQKQSFGRIQETQLTLQIGQASQKLQAAQIETRKHQKRQEKLSELKKLLDREKVQELRRLANREEVVLWRPL